MKGLTVFNWMFNAFCTNRLTSILYAPRSTGRKHWAPSSAQSCSNDKIWPDRSQAHSHLLINTTLLLNVFNPCMDDVSAWTSAELLLLKCNYGSLQWQDTAIAFAAFLSAALSWKCWYIQITERITDYWGEKISWSMLSFTFRPLVNSPDAIWTIQTSTLEFFLSYAAQFLVNANPAVMQTHSNKCK